MTELYSLHRVTLTAAGEPLFAALAAAIPGMSRHLAREAVMAGLVSIAGKVIAEPKHPLPDAAVNVACDLSHGVRKTLLAQKHGAGAEAIAKPFTILHEDSDIIVVDKAAGVLSAPTVAGEHGHVPELLRAFWRKQGRRAGYIGLIHRLDRETSGCLCFAMTREAQRLMSVQFASHSAWRTYRCLVSGQMREDRLTLSGKIGRGQDGRRAIVNDEELGKEAVTHVAVLRRFGLGAELEARLETGRTHQIRVQLADLGCPVWGDRVYGKRIEQRARRSPKPLPKPTRMMLHATLLEFDHPSSGKRLRIEAPLPPVFGEFAKMLG
ncbi:MAG: RluA family pseudouridine synthase [Planctomycetes bacterium]|nr:RluA family pseudouridine synthase [Planctomycetota bacterium]